MRVWIVAALLVATLPVSALADWQYTKWGMTVDAVAKASKGVAKPVTEPGKNTKSTTARLVAPYEAGKFAFDAYFMFDNGTGGLSSVVLELKDKRTYPDLIGSLTLKYGTPEVSGTQFMKLNRWIDRKNNNNVGVLAIGSSDLAPETVSLNYAPVRTAASDGL